MDHWKHVKRSIFTNLQSFVADSNSSVHVKMIIKWMIIVPTLLRGEELYTQMGFFLFREFSPIDIFIVESWDWYHSKARPA